MPPDHGHCGTCNKKECGSHSTWISCDCCKKWYHNQCQNLVKSEVTIITRRVSKGVKWFFTICLPSLLIKNSTQKSPVSTTDDKLDQISMSIQILTEKLHDQIAKIEEQDKSYAEVLKANIDSFQKNVQVNTKTQTILQKSLDAPDTEYRKLNAILYVLTKEQDKTAIDQVVELKKIALLGPTPHRKHSD